MKYAPNTTHAPNENCTLFSCVMVYGVDRHHDQVGPGDIKSHFTYARNNYHNNL